MPELPEVETTCQGIKSALIGEKIQSLQVFEPRLRWPIPANMADKVLHQRIISLYRRAKYIVMMLENESLIWHLGMSGSMRLCDKNRPLKKHDHVEMVLNSGVILRFNDPRRFGCLLWGGTKPLTHPLLVKLGPEPLTENFNGEYLYQRAKKRRVAVKSIIMDQIVVVGVGNIYASEALYVAGILPTRMACRISKQRYEYLVSQIKTVLRKAIDQGGTTLQDFTNVEGKPGYFAQKLQVYGRANTPCFQCHEKIKQVVIGQRASYFCARCQS